MLRAAYELFCERGYAGTTMGLIAERAGVAVQTLYFTFHTKLAILDETVGASIMGFDHWDPQVKTAMVADPRRAFAEFQPWFAKMEAARTQAGALAVFVDASLDILARVGPLVLATASAAASDPEMKKTVELGEERRVEGYTLVVELLAKRGRLRRGLDVRRGTDILLTLLSAETYQQLAVRRGWSAGECRKWLLDVLRQQLLP
jgi:AcrR family transcriptional regulator